MGQTALTQPIQSAAVLHDRPTTAFKPRSIVLFCISNAIGGTERVVLTLARGMAHRGHTVHTCIAGGPGSQNTLEWFHREGVPATISDAVVLPWGRRRVRETLNLYKYFEGKRPDAINIHYPVLAARALHMLAARLGGAGARIVTSQHHPVPWNPRRPDRKWRMRLALTFADAVTVDTPQQQMLVQQAAGPLKKLVIIPPGATFYRARASREALRHAWGIPSEARVVGSLARLVVDKGFIELIDAVAALVPTRPDLRLLVAGDGPDREQIKAHAVARLGPMAVFVGRVASPGDLYAAVDLFALPSKSEGFGIVYLEAALHGIPSVALRVDGVPYAVEHNVTGLLAEPSGCEELCMALRHLLDDPERRIAFGNAAKARAISSFSVEQMIDRYEATLLSNYAT